MTPTTLKRHSRTIEWVDPTETLAQAVTMDGIDYLKAMNSGELPISPIAELIGMSGFSEIEPGRIVGKFKPQQFHLGPQGLVHGGPIATVIDSAMGCALLSTLKAGELFATLELKINYVRPATTDQELTAVGTVLNAGRNTALVEGRMTDGRDKLIAYATSTCMVKRREAKA